MGSLLVAMLHTQNRSFSVCSVLLVTALSQSNDTAGARNSTSECWHREACSFDLQDSVLPPCVFSGDKLRESVCIMLVSTDELCRGGKLYLQASGWRVAKKDRIDLDILTLKDARGLYTCSPLTAAEQPFSCCLDVKEDMQVTRQVCNDFWDHPHSSPL